MVKEILAKDIMHEGIPAFQTNEEITRLIGTLKKNIHAQALIFEKEKYLGVFSPFKLLRTRIDKEKDFSNLAQPTAKISEKDKLIDIAILMFDSGSVILPVFENDKFTGKVVSILDILSHIDNLEFKQNFIKNIKYSSFLAVLDDMPISNLLSTMRDEHIDRFPVSDKKDRLIGFISYKDIIEKYYSNPMQRERAQQPHTQTRAFEAERPTYAELPVRNIMSLGDIISIDIKNNMKEAALMMAKNKVHSLVITRNGSPVGIVTARDLIGTIIDSAKEPFTNIQYVGLNELDLDNFNRYWVKKISSYYSEKLGNMIKNEFYVVVHVKKYNKGGKQHKYSIHLRVNYPGDTIASDKVHDWDIRRAMHMAFNSLGNEIRHRYKDKRISSFRETFEYQATREQQGTS